MIDVPEAGEFFLDTFWEISRFRAHGMNGPDPIRLVDIRHWSDMTGTQVRRDELPVIIEMDVAFRSAWADEAEANRERREAAQKTERG